MYECLEAFDTGCHLASQRLWNLSHWQCWMPLRSLQIHVFGCSGQKSSGHSWTLSFSHQQVLFTYLQNVSRIRPLLLSSTLSSLSLVFPTFILVLLESILICTLSTVLTKCIGAMSQKNQSWRYNLVKNNASSSPEVTVPKVLMSDQFPNTLNVFFQDKVKIF